MSILKNLSLLLFPVLLSACNDSNKINSLQAKVDSLSSVNNAMERELQEYKQELENYKNDPVNLCANIQELLAKEDISSLTKIKDNLEMYHPACPQLETVKSYIEKIRLIQTKRKEEEKAKRMRAVNVLNAKYDDVSNTTWYKSKLSKTSGNFCYMYIGKKTGNVWLRMKMQYHGEDWIFFNKAYLSYDGNTIEIPFDEYREKDTEVSGGVWEWIDVAVDNNILNFIKKMVTGNDVKWRLQGKYTKTKIFSTKEIEGFKEILLAYEVLQNSENR